MKIKAPLSHKCPVCKHDLYQMKKQELFSTIFFNQKYIICSTCGSSLQWRNGYPIIFFKYFLISALFLAMLTPFFKFIIKSHGLELLSISLAAGCAIISAASMFFLRVDAVICKDREGIPRILAVKD